MSAGTPDLSPEGKEQVTTSTSSPCPSADGTNHLTMFVNTAYPSIVSYFDTTQNLSVDETGFSTSTVGSGTSSPGGNVYTTPCPSTPDEVSSAASKMHTTAYLLPEQTSISSRTPFSSTYGIETSSVFINRMLSLNPSTDVPVYSSSHAGIRLSTPVSYDNVSDVGGYGTTYPTMDLAAIFTSTTHPSTDLTAASSSHKTSFALRHMTSDSGTDVSTSAVSVEAEVSAAVNKVAATLSFHSESSDIFTESSKIAESTHIHFAQSSVDGSDFKSPCCSTDLTSYSTDTTDMHGPLSSSGEVPDSISTDSSELWTTDYDSSSVSAVDVSSAGTLASSAMDNTFVDSTDMGITTEVSVSTYEHVSELLTEVRDSASDSVTETDIETSASEKVSFLTDVDDITATSDQYSLSSSIVEVPLTASADVTDLPRAQYDTTTFTPSPVVSNVSEIWPSYSTGMETQVNSMLISHTTDYTVQTKLDVSTGATSALVAASKSVYTSTKQDIASSIVTTTVTPSVYIMSSNEIHDDGKNLSTTSTSTTVASVPGDFRVYQ